MAAKIPSLFRPQLTEKAFTKNLLGKTHTPKARELLQDLYEKKGTDYFLKPELLQKLKTDKKWAKEVANLNKSIKANSGWIDPVKVGFLAALILGATAVNAMFLEEWTRQGVVAGLEGVFGAKADLEGFSFKPFEAKAGFRRLSVANKEAPQENLFVLEEGLVDLDMDALLQGKAVIENLQAKNITFGTPRETTGERPQQNQNPTPKGDTPTPMEFELPMDDFVNPLTLLSANPQQILEKEVDKLKTRQLSQEQLKVYEERTAHWKGKWEETSEDFTALSAKIKALTQTNVSKLKTAPQVTLALNDVKDASDRLKDLNQTISKLVPDFNKDVKTIQALPAQAAEVLKQDLAYLRGLVSLPSGEPMDYAGLFLTGPTLAQFYEIQGYALQAMDAGSKLSDGEKEKKTVVAAPQRKGQNVEVKGEKNFPEFWLKALNVSVAEEGRKVLDFSLKNATNRPDWVPEPLTMDVELAVDPLRPLDLRAQLGLKSTDTQAFEVSFQTEEPQFNYEVPGSLLDIKTVRAKAELSGVFSLDKNLRPGFSAKTELSEVVLEWAARSELSQLMSSIIPAGSRIQLEGAFAGTETGLEFTAHTNLDRLIERGLSAYLDQKLAQMQTRIEDEFRKLTLGDLKGLENAQKDFSAVIQQKDEALKFVAEQQAAVDKKKKELEAHLVKLQKQLTAPVEDAAKKLQGSLPKLPGL